MSNEFNIKNGFISNNNSLVIGSLTATTYYGDGQYLSGIIATNWAGGNVTNPAYFLQGLSGTSISATTFYGDGTNITGIVAAFTGGTVTGGTIVSGGLTANTLNVTGNTNLSVVTATTISGVTILRSSSISATTITAGTLTLTPLTSGTIVSSLGVDGTGKIITGQTTSNFTGGTVTGATIYTGGLTANTLNVTGLTTLPNLITTATSVTLSALTSGTIVSSLGVDSTGKIITGQTTSNFTGGTVTGNTIYTTGLTANTLNVTGSSVFTGGLTANTISATTYYNLPVSGLTQGSNINITEGPPGNFTISQGASSAINVTGGTYSASTRAINFLTNPPENSFSVTGFTSDYTRLSDWDSVNLYHYSGSAPSGSLTSQNFWTVRRISFSGASPTTMTANGSWDNRVGLSYSPYP
jgi:hypothetical protein